MEGAITDGVAEVDCLGCHQEPFRPIVIGTRIWLKYSYKNVKFVYIDYRVDGNDPLFHRVELRIVFKRCTLSKYHFIDILLLL
jgi:hypothetical protein